MIGVDFSGTWGGETVLCYKFRVQSIEETELWQTMTQSFLLWGWRSIILSARHRGRTLRRTRGECCLKCGPSRVWERVARGLVS